MPAFTLTSEDIRHSLTEFSATYSRPNAPTVELQAIASGMAEVNALQDGLAKRDQQRETLDVQLEILAEATVRLAHAAAKKLLEGAAVKDEKKASGINDEEKKADGIDKAEKIEADLAKKLAEHALQEAKSAYRLKQYVQAVGWGEDGEEDGKEDKDFDGLVVASSSTLASDDTDEVLERFKIQKT